MVTKSKTYFSTTILNGKFPSDTPANELLPFLAEGMLLALHDERSSEAVGLLKEAALSAYQTTLQKRATEHLGELAQTGDPNAILALFDLALFYDNTLSEELINQHGIVSSDDSLNAILSLLQGNIPKLNEFDPVHEIVSGFFLEENTPLRLRERILRAISQLELYPWDLILESLLLKSQSSLQNLVEKFPNFDSKYKILTIKLLSKKILGEDVIALRTLYDIYFLYDHPAALEEIEKSSLPSPDATQLALFYFLTDKWDQYESLDFDHTLLSTIYSISPLQLKNRILEHSRRSGYIDWINSGTMKQQQRMAGQLAYADWKGIIERLQIEERWNDLARIFPLAPPILGITILGILAHKNGISSHIQDALDLQEMAITLSGSSFPQPTTKKIKLSENAITVSAFSPTNSELAIGFDRMITRWNYSTGIQIGSPVIPPSSGIRALVYSHDGEYLICADGKNQIQTFRNYDQVLVKTLTGHKGIISDMAMHPKGRKLFSAGYDGLLLSWRFPEGGTPFKLYESQSEILAISVDQNTIALSNENDGILTINSNSGSVTHRFDCSKQMIMHLAISPHGKMLASASKDGQLELLNLCNGRTIFKISKLASPIQTFVIDPQERFLAASDRDHQITLYDLFSGEVLIRWDLNNSPIRGMLWVKDKNTILTVDAAGEFNQWNLDLLVLTQQSDFSNEGDLNLIMDTNNRDKKYRWWVDYLRAFLAWKRRYDIELAESQSIRVGEYDINLSTNNTDK